MKTSARLQSFLRIGITLFFTTILFTGVFFLTDAVLKALGLTLPPLFIQLVSSLASIMIMALLGTILSHIFKRKIIAGQMRVFGPIISAMDKIAQGDYNVRLDDEIHKRLQAHEPVGTLMKSINTMASGLSELEKMRQEFISNVSHEIQSPLTSIHGFAKVLQNDALSSEERHHYLSIIEAESTRLSRITDNLLKLAALESDQMRFEPKAYRLDKQIRDLILSSEPQWLAKEIEMDVALEELVVSADEDLLSQVWINLLHNSIKFNNRKGKVEIRLYNQSGKIICSIADTGQGIGKENLGHIFDRFYKADPARKSSMGGSGLGFL